MAGESDSPARRRAGHLWFGWSELVSAIEPPFYDCILEAWCGFSIASGVRFAVEYFLEVSLARESGERRLSVVDSVEVDYCHRITRIARGWRDAGERKWEVFDIS